LWLKVAASNNNPRFIASYYFECVQQVGGTYYVMLSYEHKCCLLYECI